MLTAYHTQSPVPCEAARGYADSMGLVWSSDDLKGRRDVSYLGLAQAAAEMLADAS